MDEFLDALLISRKQLKFFRHAGGDFLYLISKILLNPPFSQIRFLSERRLGDVVHLCQKCAS